MNSHAGLVSCVEIRQHFSPRRFISDVPLSVNRRLTALLNFQQAAGKHEVFEVYVFERLFTNVRVASIDRALC